eukprot:TRINITY_DN11067_c0_g1_i1.p1 TRINITY_DN11067_c0_g1~~TRINITY_DN11067_c0_g1_i1.p1  ORF type:complete len:151 (+),score=38.01 TRINITY_DN11067_c0_g1_i1:90-542(+)
MMRRPPRSTLSSSSAASDVYKRQVSTQSTGVPPHCHAQEPAEDAVMAWRGAGQSEDNLRENNESELDALHKKIGKLKEVTIQFERETSEGNKGLDLMDGDMSGVSGAVRTSMRRINQYAEATGNPRMVYLIVGFTVIITLVYYVIGRAVH